MTTAALLVATHCAAFLAGCMTGAIILALYLLSRAVDAEMEVQHDNRPEEISGV